MAAKSIGQKLIELRGARTRKEAADAIGITERALTSYEYDERIPRDETKMQIAKFYGESIESIFFTN